MTSPRDKPKEWWIQKGTPDFICDSWQEANSWQVEYREDLPWIHVIENSAYETVCRERDELEVNETKMNAALSAKQEIIESLTKELGAEKQLRLSRELWVERTSEERDEARVEVERLRKENTNRLAENDHYYYAQDKKVKAAEALLADAEKALEVYAMTNETFPEYGDVARETLARIRGKKND